MRRSPPIRKSTHSLSALKGRFATITLFVTERRRRERRRHTTSTLGGSKGWEIRLLRRLRYSAKGKAGLPEPYALVIFGWSRKSRRARVGWCIARGGPAACVLPATRRSGGRVREWRLRRRRRDGDIGRSCSLPVSSSSHLAFLHFLGEMAHVDKIS